MMVTGRLARRVDSVLGREYRQFEALVGLYSTLGVRLPLPAMRGSAVSPDFAREVVWQIAATRPQTVVELGSGVSSLVIGYGLQRYGRGTLLSLEHDTRWSEQTRRWVAWHGLESVVTVVDASLRAIEIAGQRWLWYDTSLLTGVRGIDLLIVDGPPFFVQHMARYPALPLLAGLLSPQAVIVLDDAARHEERQIVERWNEELGPLDVDFRPTERGAAILRRKPVG